MNTLLFDRVRIHAQGKPYNFYVPKQDSESLRFHMGVFWAQHLEEVAMPIPGFNGVVVRYGDFKEKLNSGKSYILTGIRADGVILEPGEASAVASGDCHTTIFYNERTGEAACLHTGRDPMLPKKLRTKPQPNDEPTNVIETLMLKTQWNPSDLRVYIAMGIGPDQFTHPFDHPQYGEYNRRILSYLHETYGEICTPGEKALGRIDQMQVIRRECMLRGIAPDKIQWDGIDTASPEAKNRWWSIRRHGDARGRNLITVHNLK